MMNNKILFISYYFPPIGGVGAIRTAKFVKFLPVFGWQPYVLTVKKGFHHFYDETLLKEVKQTKIFKVNYFEPLLWLKFRLWQSFLNYFFYPLFLIPDRQILWFFPALKAAKEIIKKEKIEIIFTSSAPASDHLIGYFLKKTTGIKWVADFRDEWSNNPLRKFPTPIHRFLNKIWERKIVRSADEIISVAPSLTNYLTGLSENPKKCHTITNGFDSDDFRDFKDQTSKKFCQIIYTGSLYDYHLQKIFLEALSGLDLKNLKVDFIGLDRRIPHLKAVQNLARADILLLLLDPVQRPAVFTGKLFEYLAAKKPILALAPANSGAAKLIGRLKVGEVANPLDKEEIKIKILQLYRLWQKNKLKVPEIDLANYERKNLTRKLANIFEGLTRIPERKRMRLKLCLIGNLQSPQNQNLVSYFVKKDYEIHFISTKPGRIAKVKTYYLNPCRNPVYFFLKSLYQIRRLIRQIKPDIVHGQDLVFAGIWAHLSGFRPVVVTSWGSDIMNYNKFIGPEKYLIGKTLQNADLVTGTSLAIKNQAIRIGMAKEKFQLVHFGIDLNIFKSKKGDKKPVIFCPRAIAPIYNTDILIKAFYEISKKNPKTKLALLENVADERYLIEIEKLIIRLGLVDKVQFWPKVANQKMADYYNKAEVVVSISSSDGCSVSFLEAMACERKIVASDLDYLKEWTTNKNLWLVSKRDVKATAKAILAAFKFPQAKWRKIGKANRQLIAEKAEVNSNFEKLDRLYREIINF